jgi:putative protease
MTASGKIELMAPAGNFESMQAALDNGCDSIYFGVEQLNMRARATVNFILDDLPEIARRCNEKNVRTYLTLNTIIYDHDLSIVKTLLTKAKEAGITAVIASDQAVIMTARTIGIEVHISTQLNVTNIETVKFYAMFADTIVLSRELSLRQVKKITNDIEKEQIKGPSGHLVEIEIFGHGALCMAVSGKCFEIEVDNEYLMSPKDLCTLDFLDQVIDSGIKVLKIEGRGRAADYVATVIKTYREAIDSFYDGTFTKEKISSWMEALATVYNRGFWSGYYLGQKLGEWSDNPGSSATQKKVYIGKGMHYFPKSHIAEFKIEAYDIKKGDKLLITGPSTGAQELILDEFLVNDNHSEKASKGDSCTMKIPFRIRLSDKMYKIVEN